MRTVLCYLLLCGAAFAHDTVTDTEIVSHHGDRVPRFDNVIPGNHLVVAAGETFTLPPDSTLDAIEVAGTLKVSREHDTVCRFTHLQILPGGKLDCGTEADPVLRSVEFIVRDVPLATGTVEHPGPDPFQWGNGILCFGEWRMHGRSLTPWVTFPGADAGATGIPVPADWRDRDSLLLPDVRQITATAPVRRESPVNLLGGVLSKPLDFEHQPIVTPDGETVHLPIVANATRNIVVRSENPQGVRGHTVVLGGGFADVRYAAFLGLGRTLPINLDNTTVDSAGKVTKIGTNQIARYAWHWHHVHNSPGTLVGCYFNGTNIGKWGVVVHSSHGMGIEHNIADQFVGAGFVTEDGPETRNTFDGNLAMGSRGNGIDGKFNMVPPRNIPGGEGSGFWFHGPHNFVRNNVSVNNAVGFQWMYMNQVSHPVPDESGVDRPFDATVSIPLEVANNVALSNSTGFEYWRSPRFNNTGAISAFNSTQVLSGNGENANIWLSNCSLVAHGGVGSGVRSIPTYTSTLELDGGLVAGCGVGVGEAVYYVRLRNLTMQNVVNINHEFFRPIETIMDGVVHEPLGAHPKRYIILGKGYDWKPGQPIPNTYTAEWHPATGKRYVVRNWQGTGDDYLLFETQSLSHKPAWPNNGALGLCPEDGLTFGECWEKYGFAYGGGVVDQDDAVPLEGVVNGVGKLGTDYPLGPPRAVMVSPSPLLPTSHKNGLVFFRFIQTGQDQFSKLPTFMQVDGDQEVQFTPLPGLASNQRQGNVAVPVTPGTHTVKTWRVDAAGQKLPGSELSFTYFVGEPSPPPPPPEVWEPANIGPPFNGDAGLRVRNGVIEKLAE